MIEGKEWDDAISELMKVTIAKARGDEATWSVF
jgi:hypothetical protein